MKVLILCAGRSTRDGLVKKDIERCRILVQRFGAEIGRADFTVAKTHGARATASTLVSMGLGVREVNDFAWRTNFGIEIAALYIKAPLSAVLILSEEDYMVARDYYVTTLHWATVGDVVRPGPLVGSLVDTDGHTVEFIDPDKHR